MLEKVTIDCNLVGAPAVGRGARGLRFDPLRSATRRAPAPSRFGELAQAMPTYRSYSDKRINDTYVGFMKRHSDYHVTIPAPS